METEIHSRSEADGWKLTVCRAGMRARSAGTWTTLAQRCVGSAFLEAYAKCSLQSCPLRMTSLQVAHLPGAEVTGT